MFFLASPTPLQKGAGLLFILFIALFLSGCRTVAQAPDPEPASHYIVPIDQLPELTEIRRGDLLEKLHPELVDRARLLYALLELEGIHIRFISGHRPLENDARPNRLASWHNLGMAFDLNIVGRDYAYYKEDQKQWERIGEVATGLGLIWGERYDDIFHFEWHPDYHARIRQHEFDLFRRFAGRRLQNHQATWHLFDPERADPDALPCFGGCHEIPDEGLRNLLEDLRLH